MTEQSGAQPQGAEPGELLRMRGIVKRFPGVLALSGVDLDVRAGEVHCLLGQNGAGKSTLIKVLSAAYQPEEGEIAWAGEPVRLATPVAAMRLGISTIYQELDLVPGLTVTENVFLGRELSRGGFTRTSEATGRVRDILRRLGHSEVDPSALVGDLSPAAQQIVSMARALSHDTRLLILDEPSAVLDQEEVRNLFRVIRDLTAEGVAIVYISHRLEEIREIGDRITVLKDGRTVATGLPAQDTPTAELIKLMTGRAIEYVFPPRPEGDRSAADPVLEVRELAGEGRFRDVTFDVRAGEIVGLAGLVGSGRSEILETVYGARRASAGTVSVAGRKLRKGSVRAAVAAGVGLAPEERKSQALLLDQAVYRNITVSSLGRFARGGFLDDSAERARAEELSGSLDVRPTGVERPVRTLSGGNQQKVVLARWLLRECKVLLLDEPTRGVDVGARSEIYKLIRRLADDGVAVVVVSSEVEEVLGLADRVLVVREGRVVHEGPATEIDESGVLDLVMEGEVA
ncbi:monosaccharide ABC transporter ATP-binding protein (CUT2 family) [Nocardioides albertanoniae]|uniref:Monosaccharide ABC transporter ATP-binding protein (CUT2 family) n=1 Tax=Nocardioides albertanoniae TaxID=1175486 RepID=A0A543A521_9ACTN|nr:sugar ABC transporter ATP-binding protein [Nocardioides albertanoniae]TQL67576.1 monosaccharide ABC transporter ATP-binding protein (CUT2 family) [Nocardioides albertanoniae]